MRDTICSLTIKGANNKRYFHLKNVSVLWDYVALLHIHFRFHEADKLVNSTVLLSTLLVYCKLFFSMCKHFPGKLFWTHTVTGVYY